jgi:hypothetical protein
MGCRQGNEETVWSPETKVRCIVSELQPQVPIRLRSGQAFDSAEVRFAQDDSVLAMQSADAYCDDGSR